MKTIILPLLLVSTFAFAVDTEGNSDIGSSGRQTESLIVCGNVSATVSSNGETSQIWEKVDLNLNTDEKTLSYDRYIGVIGQPKTNKDRNLSFSERFKFNNSSTRDSGKFVDLQELDVADVTGIISDINPQDVEKFYMGETLWSGQQGFLIKLKNGHTIFSTGMVYSTEGAHCQQFKKN